MEVYFIALEYPRVTYLNQSPYRLYQTTQITKILSDET